MRQIKEMTVEPEPWIRDRNCFSTRMLVDPARREEFLSIFADLCVAARAYYDRGCKFAFQGWGRDPNEFVIFASWDEDVVQELRQDPGWRRGMAGMLECCDGPMIMEQYSGMNKDRGVFEIYPAGESKVHNAGPDRTVVFL